MMKSKVKFLIIQITKTLVINYSGAKMIIKSLDLIEEKKLFLKQNENDATYAKIEKKETKIGGTKRQKKLLQKLMVYIQNLDVGFYIKV